MRILSFNMLIPLKMYYQGAHQALCPWNFPGKNTAVGCHFLLLGIFPTQGLNLGFMHCRHILYHLSHQGSPRHPYVCSVTQSFPTLCDPWTAARQAPLSMGFSRQNTRMGCHFLLQGNLPDPGIEPKSLCLLHWQAGSLPLSHLGSQDILMK